MGYSPARRMVGARRRLFESCLENWPFRISWREHVDLNENLFANAIGGLLIALGGVCMMN
jgi:hypothetical protein